MQKIALIDAEIQKIFKMWFEALFHNEFQDFELSKTFLSNFKKSFQPIEMKFCMLRQDVLALVCAKFHANPSRNKKVSQKT